MNLKNAKIFKISLLYIIFIFLGCFAFLVLLPNTIELFQKDRKSISAHSDISNEKNDVLENILQDNTELFTVSVVEKSIIAVDNILLKLSVVENDTTVPNDNNSTTSTKSNNNQSNNKTSNTSVASSNGKPYYLKVNYTANVITVYKLDDEGNYTVPVKAMICSTGTATPRSGKYRLGGKYRWVNLFGGVYGQYATHVVGNILIHSVPYKKRSDPSSLKYYEYDKLGTACSMGCIRTTVIDAKWIYDNVASGTYIEFYSDSNPGPLGKPSARKISSNVDYRGWDPTDPDPNNPWRNAVTETPVTPEPTPAPTPVPTTNNTNTINNNTVNTNTNTSKNNTLNNINTSTGNTNSNINNTNSIGNTNSTTNNSNSTGNTNSTTNNNNSTSNTNSTTNNTNSISNTNNHTTNGNTNSSGNSITNNTPNSTNSIKTNNNSNKNV